MSLLRPLGVLGVEPGVGEPAPASTLRRRFGVVVAFLSVEAEYNVAHKLYMIKIYHCDCL